MTSKEEINQTYCLLSQHGSLWMENYYDRFTPAVRRRLQQSPYNLCPACFEMYVVPRVRALYPQWSEQQIMLRAAEVMEYEVREKEAGRR